MMMPQKFSYVHFRCLDEQQRSRTESDDHQRRVDEIERLRLENAATVAAENAAHQQRKDENQKCSLHIDKLRLQNEATMAAESAAHQKREDENKKLELENESRPYYLIVIVIVEL